MVSWKAHTLSKERSQLTGAMEECGPSTGRSYYFLRETRNLEF